MISKKMIGLVKNSSVIRAMFEEGKRLSAIYGEENVFDYSLGNPNVEPPEAIKIAINNILEEENPNEVHGYMNNSGYEDVREKIANYINKNNDLDLSYKDIIMTCGAAGGLNIILKTIINSEDEVITFAPFFGEYENYVKNYEGKLIVVQSEEKTFQPDIEALEKAINERTKAIIINSPNNPTGIVYTEESIKKLADVLEKKQKEYGIEIFLISDEPYKEIVYDDIKVPYILKYYDNSFIGYSYSKSLSLPGERIGYIAVNPKMNDIDDILGGLNVANRILGFVNAPSLFQKVIGRTLGTEVDANIYKRNRDLLYNHLISLGFECIKPDGAFYLFPKSLLKDEKEFVEIAKKYNILMVPGSSFGRPNYVRLSYCISYDKIKKSLEAFTKLAEECKKINENIK